MGGSLKEARVALAVNGAVVAFPAEGAFRVHPRPDDVYQPAPSGDGSPQPPGPNRFDDPYHHYSVRYLAELLYVCLLEVLARLRDHQAADQVLEQMDPGLDHPELADLHDPEQVRAVENFLATNRVANFGPPTPAVLAKLVDVFDGDLLAALDDHHWVRDELTRPEVVAAYGETGQQVHLDGSLIRNASSKVGRPVTQRISRLLLDIIGVRGLRYFSRHEGGDAAKCWAVLGHVHLPVRSLEALDPANEQHRAAVQLVAGRYRLPLPAAWVDATSGA